MAVANAAASLPNPVPHESQVRMRQAAISLGGAVCLLGAAVVEALGPQPKVSELTIELITTNQRIALEVVGAVINSLGLLGLAFTLSFLFQASRARRPGSAPAVRIAALAGGGLAAVGGVAYAIVLSIKAHQFGGAQTYLEAKDLVGSTGIAVLQYAGLLGSLALAISFVLVSMNAMRVGLLTKFLGYLGMVAAAASLFLIGSAPALLVEVFWLAAVAYLLAGRWPNGDPKAWTTGVAEPWPTAAEVREQRQRAAGRSSGDSGSANGRTGGASKSPAKPAAGAQQASGGNQPARTANPKRKRKRRK